MNSRAYVIAMTVRQPPRRPRGPTLAAAALAVAAACAPGASPEPVSSDPTAPPPGEAPALLPAPRRAAWSGGTLSLPTTIACAAGDSLRPLVDVLDRELGMLAGGRVVVATDARNARCRLTIDPALGEQEYTIRIGDDVRLSGGSYAAVAMGSVTLLQSLRREDGSIVLPRGEVDDAPLKPYRGLLVDVARDFHDVEVLEQLVELARWYKVNYLQLHLTDDQSFTFPSEAYPELPTPGRHYTKEELRRLDEFARARGVALLPELEVPGHGGQLTERLPEVFAISDRARNPGTINMGRDTVYAALDAIVGEIADVFRASPYIHIGGDEASRAFLEDDPDVRRYLARHDLSSVEELYRHFLVRVHEMVKRHGKRTIVWEGFHREGEVEIPRDILVMAWETKYQLPQDLLAGGYTLLNVSWKPLYVVNEKEWPVDSIYARWNLWRWENWVPGMPSFEAPIQLEPTPRVIGASMASWHQPQHVTLPSTRLRLAAMSERTWNGTLEPMRPLEWFRRALVRTDAALDRLLTAVRIDVDGLTYPALEDGHYGEERWFGDTLVVALSADSSLLVRYTLDGTPPTAGSPRAERPLVLRESAMLRARAFTPAGDPVGYGRWTAYELHPVSAVVTGWTGTPPGDVWELMAQELAFDDTLTIALAAARPGTIRVTMDDTMPTPASREYAGPIRLTSAAVVRAQLFDESGRPVGEPWIGRYRPATAGGAR